MNLKIDVLLLCFVFIFSCMPRGMILPSPESFSDVSGNMKTPYFWISKIQNPDRVILSKEEIDSFNKNTKEKK